MATGRTTKVLLLLVAAGTIAVYVYAFALSTTKDRPDQLDTDVVKAAAATACGRLRSDLAALPALPATASAADRSARVAEQSRRIAELVSGVRSVGQQALDEDVPAREWLGDWESLAAARTAYAAGGGGGPFSQPTALGRPLSDRMNRIGVPACEVPAALLTAP